MRSLKSLTRLTVAIALAAGGAHASPDPAARIDSGLGELPPYSEWQRHPELARFVVAHRVDGEKVDSGLGELPRYSEWKWYPPLAPFVVESSGHAAIAPTELRRAK